jgi:uroporphyrinogen-III synthase
MRVLVTRPESEARQWVDALRRHGFDAEALALIEIAATAEPRALIDAWQELHEFRAVMFVSVNAVRHFFNEKPAGIVWADGTRAWAPGTGTQAALVEAGVDYSLLDAPAADAAQFDSETLWQRVSTQVQPGDRVLIVRGADAQGASSGRDWLADQLEAAGAQLQVIAAYLRRAPTFDDRQLARARQAAADASVWLFSSSQAIAHLQALLPQQDWSHANAIATHPRIAQAARRAGFGVVCESRPGVDAVMAALESFR